MLRLYKKFSKDALFCSILLHVGVFVICIFFAVCQPLNYESKHSSSVNCPLEQKNAIGNALRVS